MDKHISYYRSPVGTLEISMIGDKVDRITFCEDQQDIDPPATKEMRSLFMELDAYLDGSLPAFKTPITLDGTEFEQSVLHALTTIPYGQTRSYKDIAKQIGNIQSVRAVGRANGANRIPILIPCHRVIGEDGSLTGFAGGLEKKSWLLTHEGALAKQLSAF
jgi:O-6-methylguanine DNA methyltransferase